MMGQVKYIKKQLKSSRETYIQDWQKEDFLEKSSDKKGFNNLTIN